MDPNGHGSYTDSIPVETVAEAGAVGTLINHSEKRLKLADIDGSVQAAERAGLETRVCTNNPAQIGVVSALGPDSVVVESPELIGGNVSVATADPGIVTDAVDAAANMGKGVEICCGADISTDNDVVTAEELDASGILLASGAVKADDPCTAPENLVSGL